MQIPRVPGTPNVHVEVRLSVLLSPPLRQTISIHNDRRILHVTDVTCDVWAERRRSLIVVITGTLPTMKEDFMQDGCLARKRHPETFLLIV